MNRINISGDPDKTDFRDHSFLREYAMNNQNNLRKVRYEGTGSIGILIANNSGWCTVYLPETNQISQGWAGIWQLSIL
jgi:hypothetical protein